MFDRIMENAMPLWMLASALFPIFFFGTIIKAFLHYRRTREAMESLPVPSRPRMRIENQDWVPSP
jgi:hypothetical protein